MMMPAYSDPCYLLDNISCLSSGEFFPAPLFPIPSTNFDAEFFPAPLFPLPNLLPVGDSFDTYAAVPANEAPAKTNNRQKITQDCAPAKTNKKRNSRTDRHSKIHTAQGLRDRRMRLSVDVARKFFGLQDLLGFDKASATVDWLITQSKGAIEQQCLMHFSKNSSNNIVNSHNSPIAARSSSTKKLHLLEAKEKELVQQPSASRRGPFHQLLTRKSRAEARARARERTKEKKKKIPVEVDGGEAAAGHLESTAKLECPIRPEGIDYQHLSMSPNISFCNYRKDYSISSNEKRMNFLEYEQVNGNYSGDQLEDQQPSDHLLAEVQFQSCKACNMGPII